MVTSPIQLQLTPKNWPAIQKSARKNIPSAQHLMGVAYMLGGLVEVDKIKAFYWFEKAARNNHADAAFRCGYLLSSGGVEIASEDPGFWYRLAAELGSAAGMVAAGNLWTFKKLESQRWWHRFLAPQDQSADAVEAFQWYKKAAEKEYSASLYFLGLHSLKGWGTKKDKKQALAFLEEGVIARDQDCAFLLAQMENRGGDKFLSYCERAADWGHAQAQYELAMYLFSTNRQSSQAVSWLRRSAMQRYPTAMLYMAKLYERGQGVLADRTTAYIWARRAVESGANARGLLAIMYGRLNTEERNYVTSVQAQKDDIEFFRLSKTLFGEPVVPVAPDA